MVVVVLLVIAFPWILAKTGLRDRLLTAIVASNDVKVSSRDASFGYFTSLSLSGLQIKARDDSAQIDVARIESDHSWLGLLLSRPELGTFRFQRPEIDVLVKEAPKAKPAVAPPSGVSVTGA